jgi:Stage II sporulation protein E (SpoIIE)/Phosphoserine phosphatase RsbU, N-terminal domain
MAGPANKRSARGAGTPRKRFERHYERALESHFHHPTERGLAEAHDLGRQALADGVDILDVVGIHMEARRGLFPGVGSQFADIDAFLLASLTAFQNVREELRAAQLHAVADSRRIDALRRLRDVAAELSRATTRRAVASAMLRTTLEITGAQVGTVVLFRGRTRGRDRRPDLLATIPRRDARRLRALGAAAHALDGLLEAHSSLELSTPAEVRSAIGDGPTDALAADTLAAYPIVWRDAVRGALILTATGAGAFEHLDRDLIDAVVVMGVPALERAGRYDIDHEIALKLQRGMLLVPEFDLPEMRWSAHYSSAATGLVGGDWYDAIELEDRVGFAIGDIVGRGIDAAVAMGQVRSASRALANCFDKPHEVVEGLDHFVSATGCGEDSSMAYLTINRKSGEVVYSVAGHPPPLLLLADGKEAWLDKASSSLLGRGDSRSSASVSIDPGTTLVLYTDGLVERRGELLDAGLARLVQAAQAVADQDEPARQLVERASAEWRVDDDVAVVVVSFVGS